MSSCDAVNVTHFCPAPLWPWVQHCTTATTEFMCCQPLCHSHWGARQRAALGSLCSFCPVFCKACDNICPSSRPPQGSSRKTRGYIRSKGQDGILWRCQYVVNWKQSPLLEQGWHAQLMYTVLEFLQCRVRGEASLLAFPPQRQLRVHAWNAVHRQTASLHFPSVKTEIMLTSLLIWRLVDVVL